MESCIECGEQVDTVDSFGFCLECTEAIEESAEMEEYWQREAIDFSIFEDNK